IQALGGERDEFAIDGVALEEDLGNTGEERDVPADVRLNVEASDLRSEQQAAHIRGNTEIDEPQFFERVDHDHVPAAPANLHEIQQQARVIGGRVAAKQHE